VAAIFLVWAVGEVVVGAVHGPVVVTVAAGALTTVPLAWRRMLPATAGVLASAGVAFKTVLGVNMEGLALLAAVFFASYSAGRHLPARRALVTVGVMVALVWSVLWRVPGTGPYDWIFALMWIGGPGLAGAAFRDQLARAARLADRAARAEVQREEHAREAVRLERDRIAREMHDTLAHAVSVMVLHAGAVRSRLPEELASERAALDQCEETGRRSIADLRRMLGLLRDDDGTDLEPQPRLTQLDALVEESRRLGLTVTVRREGLPTGLDPSVEVSAYRIVQEALTNVRKHARASTAQVLLRFQDGEVQIRVTDDGTAAGEDGEGKDAWEHGEGTTQVIRGGTDGYGLLGIRERVELYGGRMSTRHTAQGFVLDASLPAVAS
jgi:signal transduction histidine kinase